MVTTRRPVLPSHQALAFAYLNGQFYYSDEHHPEIMDYLRGNGVTRDQLASATWGTIYNESDDEVPNYLLELGSDTFGMGGENELLDKLDALFPGITSRMPLTDVQGAVDEDERARLQQFFEDASKGLHTPVQPLQEQFNDPNHQAFYDEYQNHAGNFDQHIETSIPGFRKNFANKGFALLQAYPQGRVLDIGASEGSFGKTLSSLSNGQIQTTSLDPNPTMAQFFNSKSQVPGATYDERAFWQGFTDNHGTLVPRADPNGDYDVVHETMAFQFIGPERDQHIEEAKAHLKPGGLFLTEEKVITPNFDENEQVKDEQFKNQYYSPEQLVEKQKQVKFQAVEPGFVPPIGSIWKWMNVDLEIVGIDVDNEVFEIKTLDGGGPLFFGFDYLNDFKANAEPLYLPGDIPNTLPYSPEEEEYYRTAANWDEVVREKAGKGEFVVGAYAIITFSNEPKLQRGDVVELIKETSPGNWIIRNHDGQYFDYPKMRMFVPPSVEEPTGNLWPDTLPWSEEEQNYYRTSDVYPDEFPEWGKKDNLKAVMQEWGAYNVGDPVRILVGVHAGKVGNVGTVIHNPTKTGWGNWMHEVRDYRGIPYYDPDRKDERYTTYYHQDELEPWDNAATPETIGDMEDIWPDADEYRNARVAGMMDNMTTQDELEALLKKHFRHVAQYWSSGNFKAYAASDDPTVLNNYLSKYKFDENNQYATEELPRAVTSTWNKTTIHDWDEDDTEWEDDPDYEESKDRVWERLFGEQENEPIGFPKYEKGDSVIFRGYGDKGSVQSSYWNGHRWWCIVNRYDSEGYVDQVHVPEEELERASIGFDRGPAMDQPSAWTLEDFGIPPEGEEYYRNAAYSNLPKPGAIYELNSGSMWYVCIDVKDSEFLETIEIIFALSDMFGYPIKNPTIIERIIDADHWHEWLRDTGAFLVGWNPEFNKGPEQIGEQPKVDEFAQQWPDTLPWGDAEQDYYRTSTTEEMLRPGDIVEYSGNLATPYRHDEGDRWTYLGLDGDTMLFQSEKGYKPRIPIDIIDQWFAGGLLRVNLSDTLPWSEDEQQYYRTSEHYDRLNDIIDQVMGLKPTPEPETNVLNLPMEGWKFQTRNHIMTIIEQENGQIYYTDGISPHVLTLSALDFQELIQNGVWKRIAGWTKKAEDDTMQGMDTQATGTLTQLVNQDQAAKTALNALQAAGGQVYVVGGAVRDALMGNSPKDIDLMVQGLEPEQIQQVLSPLGRLDFTGAAFGVFRFKKGNDDVEIALPRLERSTGSGHKDFEVNADPYLPAEEDLHRRDFTINAMAFHPQSGVIIDPHGGQEDLTKKKLALVNPGAFNDDPLRIVRALVATARYGFEPDPQLLVAMDDQASAIRHLPGERLRMEMDKLMSSPNPAAAMNMAEQTGVLDYLAPEVSGTVGFSQWNPHHDLDVWNHTMQVLRKATQISNDPDVRLAALFHDSGKPDSFWRDEDAPEGGGGHFYKKKLDDGSFMGEDHEEVGGDLVREFMDRLRYPTKRIERVEFLVRNHMFPYFDTPKGARKFLKRCNGDAKLAFDLLALREADASGKRSGEMNDFDTTQIEKARSLLREVLENNQPVSTKALAINGNDLIQLGMKPGPEIGKVLNYLLDEVMDNPDLNNREDLLRLVR